MESITDTHTHKNLQGQIHLAEATLCTYPAGAQWLPPFLHGVCDLSEVVPVPEMPPQAAALTPSL